MVSKWLRNSLNISQVCSFFCLLQEGSTKLTRVEKCCIIMWCALWNMYVYVWIDETLRVIANKLILINISDTAWWAFLRSISTWPSVSLSSAVSVLRYFLPDSWNFVNSLTMVDYNEYYCLNITHSWRLFFWTYVN